PHKGGAGASGDAWFPFVTAEHGASPHSELTKASSASRSVWDSAANLLRAAYASTPCQRIASVTLLARPSSRNRVCPLTVSVSPTPQSGGVRHWLPLASPSGRLSASPSPMSCSSISV